jgi:hypothetical protein
MSMRAQATLVFAIASAAAACGGDPPPGRTYYERTIEPLLIASCSGNTSGCHSTNPDDPFDFAAGNLDVTSFEALQKRRDVLVPFGNYPVPLLLIKAVGAGQLQMAYGDEFRDVMVPHAGGGIFQVGSEAYLTLLSWTENGATENGLRPPSPARESGEPCTSLVPASFDPVAFATDPVYVANRARFDADVAPVLETCNSGNCHGAPQSDFFISCGDTPEQRAFNFAQTWAFVDNPVDESQILRIPLAAGARFRAARARRRGRLRTPCLGQGQAAVGAMLTSTVTSAAGSQVSPSSQAPPGVMHSSTWRRTGMVEARGQVAVRCTW